MCFPFLHLITLLHINSVKGSNGKGPGSELMVPGETTIRTESEIALLTECCEGGWDAGRLGVGHQIARVFARVSADSESSECVQTFHQVSS